jgi:hypothetical protein
MEMKTISKIACCAVALAWMFSANADEDTFDQGSGPDQATEAAPAAANGTAAVVVADAPEVPTPPAPRITVAPYHDKVNRASLEKRMHDRALRNEKRAADAEKDVADRESRRLQGLTNSAPNGQ